MTTVVTKNSALQKVLRSINETPDFQRALVEINRGARVLSISGLVAGSARALALAALQRETGKRFAIVTQSNRDLEPWEGDLRFWYCALAGAKNCENEVLVLPSSESDPYAGSSPHPETLERRALTLWRLARHRQDFVLLTARALARRTVTADEIADPGVVLAKDNTQSPEELVYKLGAAVFGHEDPVGGVGEVSIRGGIIDVWLPGEANSARHVFFCHYAGLIRRVDSGE